MPPEAVAAALEALPLEERQRVAELLAEQAARQLLAFIAFRLQRELGSAPAAAVFHDLGRILENMKPVPLGACPACGVACEAAVGVGHGEGPRPGDIATCASCGADAIFDDELQLRKP